MSGIVSQAWLCDHLDDDRIKILEVDQDPYVHGIGHIPGALFLAWDHDLQDPGTRDVVTAEGFAALMSRLGIRADDVVVVYGDQGNLWAAYAYWVLRLWGHADVRLLDGGHAGWAAAGLPLVASDDPVVASVYPTPARILTELRAGTDDVRAALHTGDFTVLDARSTAGYAGEPYPAFGYPLSVAHRPGHIPGAVSLPWTSLSDKETFRYWEPTDLRQRFEEAGIDWSRPVIAYCIVGAASALTCALLADHLGHPDVRNYDGSWLEWGGRIGLPVAR